MTLSEGRLHQTEPLEPVTKADYVEFFKEVVDYYDQDYPDRIIEDCTFARVPPLKILQADEITKWAAVEATMYELTGKRERLARANELLLAVARGIQHAPPETWDYIPCNTPEDMERFRRAYEGAPEKARWHGRPWLSVGGFGFGGRDLTLACDVVNRVDGWESPAQKQEVEAALAWVIDYNALGEEGAWFYGVTNNIGLSLSRTFLGAARLMPDHPHAEQWRDWGIETFRQNFNRRSPEDSAGYEPAWFYALLTTIELLMNMGDGPEEKGVREAAFKIVIREWEEKYNEKRLKTYTGWRWAAEPVEQLCLGEEIWRLPYHRAYFEHLKEIVTPSGACAAYGDCGDYGNASLLAILEKGATVFRDGVYKYGVLKQFKAIQRMSIQERADYVRTLRWFDAYRWADDSVKPVPPPAGSTLTHKAMVFLRSGSPPEQTYLALCSQDRGISGHFDANAIAHFSRGESALLRDGNYHWKQAFFRERCLTTCAPRKAPGTPTPMEVRLYLPAKAPPKAWTRTGAPRGSLPL